MAARHGSPSGVARQYGQHARDEGVQFRHVVAQELLGDFVGDLQRERSSPITLYRLFWLRLYALGHAGVLTAED